MDMQRLNSGVQKEKKLGLVNESDQSEDKI